MQQQQPARIVSLVSSGTEVLYALGLGENVVGVSHECDFPPEVARKPKLTRSAVDSSAASGQIDEQVKRLTAEAKALYELDRAALVELRPDLVVTQAQCDVCAVRFADVVDAVRCSPELAHTQIMALNPQSLGDVFADIVRIGKATDVSTRAELVVNELEARVEAIRARVAAIPLDERPRVACIEWIEPLMLAANWVPELIEIAGGASPLTVGGAHSTYANWHDVVDFDPQVLVVAPCGFDLARTKLEAKVLTSWPRVAELCAFRDRRVWALDGNAYLNRSGPRLVESVEILANLIHPHLSPLPRHVKSEAVARLFN